MAQAKAQYQYAWLSMDYGGLLWYDGTWSVTMKHKPRPNTKMHDRVWIIEVYKSESEKAKIPNTVVQQWAGSVIMGNTLMQHRLAIAGFQMPGMKVSWRERMKKFKNTTREERAGWKLQAEARQGMKRLTTLFILPLVCVLPLLWMSTEGLPNLPCLASSLNWISEFQDGAFSLADWTFLVLDDFLVIIMIMRSQRQPYSTGRCLQSGC